jgi:hypothetical protein
MVGTMTLRELTVVALLPLAFAACFNTDKAGAEALWDDVHDADYTSWERAPGYPERTPSTASHGNMVDIYLNDVMAEALAAGEALTEWPEGSIIVKDGFEGESPHLVAIMEKREDGWFWAEYKPSGKPKFSGSPKLCTDCHGVGADFVRAFGFPVAAEQ